MGMENWLQQALDGSCVARAIRKMAAKSTMLGCMDAMQNPNAVLAEMGVTESGAPEVKSVTTDPPAGPSQPVALPRPTLLAVGKEHEDEPDRPGVPPRRVRGYKRQPSSNGDQHSPKPENDKPDASQ
jgi:hypothetical protein